MAYANRLHWVDSKYTKKILGGASPAPREGQGRERPQDFFVKKLNEFGLLNTIDIPDFMEYVAYKLHTFSCSYVL